MLATLEPSDVDDHVDFLRPVGDGLPRLHGLEAVDMARAEADHRSA